MQLSRLLDHREEEAEAPFQIERSGKPIPVIQVENKKLKYGGENSLEAVKTVTQGKDRMRVVAEHEDGSITVLLYDPSQGGYTAGERMAPTNSSWENSLKHENVIAAKTTHETGRGQKRHDEYALHIDHRVIPTGEQEPYFLDYRDGEVHFHTRNQYHVKELELRNLNKQFPVVQIGDGGVEVNGVPWEGAEDMAHFHDMRVRHDHDHTLISNARDKGSGNYEDYGVMMDGTQWHSTIGKVEKMELAGDIAAVLDEKGGPKADQFKGRLFVNDCAWEVSAVIENESTPDVNDFSLNRVGRIAASVATYEKEMGKDGEWVEDVVVGGAHGPELKWNTRFKKVGKLAVGEGEDGAVAALGQTDQGKWLLAVNDVPCEELRDIHTPISLTVEGNNAVVEYVSIKGERATARVALKENAGALTKAKEARQAQQQALDSLVQMLAEQKMTPAQLLEKLSSTETGMQQTNERNESQKRQIISLEKQVSEISVAKLQMENEVKNLYSKERELTQSLNDINQALRGVQQEIRPARVGKGFVMNESVMEKLKQAQELSQREKEE